MSKSDLKQALFEKAAEARLRSYSPYSQCKVGAAIRLSNQSIFSGCNVENASYGGTVCAERTAILKAVSETGTPLKIEEIVVVTDATPPWPPCGLCRQVIAEFAAPHAQIHAMNLQGECRTSTFEELLPQAFVPQHLQKPIS